MNKKNTVFSDDDLVEAIKNKDLIRVQEYVANKGDWLKKILVVNGERLDALRVAAWYANDNIQLFQYILSELAKLEKRDPKDILNSIQGAVGYECTPLHYAVRLGEKDTITQFINLGADIAVKSHYGRTVLSEALDYDNHPTTEELLRLRPVFLQEFFTSDATLFSYDENYLQAKMSKLLTAVCAGDLPTIEKYAEENCYWLQIPLSGSMTALHCAASNGHSHILNYMVAKLAQDQNKSKGDILNQTRTVNGYTAIDFAISSGKLEPVTILLDQGADIGMYTYKDDHGEKYQASLLHRAVSYDNQLVIEELLRRKPELLLTVIDRNGKRADEHITKNGCKNYLQEKKNALQTALGRRDLSLVLKYVQENSCWLKIPLQQAANAKPQSLQHNPEPVAYCILETPAENIIAHHAAICDLVFKLQCESLTFKGDMALAFSEQRRDTVKAKYSDVFQFLNKCLPRHNQGAVELLKKQVLQLWTDSQTESNQHMKTVVLFQQPNTTAPYTATTVAPAQPSADRYQATIDLYMALGNNSEPERYPEKLTEWLDQVNILAHAQICKNSIHGLWKLAKHHNDDSHTDRAIEVLEQLNLKVKDYLAERPEDEEIQKLQEEASRLRQELVVNFRRNSPIPITAVTAPEQAEPEMTTFGLLTAGFTQPLQKTAHVSQQHDRVTPSNERVSEKNTGMFSF